MAKKPVVVVMAAGMGSRYGGLKQIDPVGCCGEAILDFSLFDAHEAGFETAVIIIKEAIKDDFMEMVGKRLASCPMEIRYAYQELDKLPAGYAIPEGRTKPWGTCHAVLCGSNAIGDVPFAVINADDFYGRNAYELLAKHLSSAKAGEFCMVGYILANTLTENGTVSRGVCEVKDGYLTDVVERTRIAKGGDTAVFYEGYEEVKIPYKTIVSMNCWGFTPDIFAKVMDGFKTFLDNDDGNIKREYYLPFAVREIMEQNECTVKVYSTTNSWYGVTYKEDHDSVSASLMKLKADGTYPSRLNDTRG